MANLKFSEEKLKEIEQYYIIQNHSRKDTEEKFQISSSTLKRHFKKKTRVVKDFHHNQANYTDLGKKFFNDTSFAKEFLNKNKKMTLIELSQQLGCSGSVTSSFIIKNNLTDKINYYGRYFQGIVKKELEKAGFVVEENNRKLLDGLEIDLYISSLKVGIEVNDTKTHSYPLKPANYHQNKSLLAKAKGIRLIHIFEWEIFDGTLENVIQTLLPKKSINAGSCKSKKISWKETKEFLDENHRQKSGANTGINYGLYFQGLLYCLMTFKKKNEGYELVRFCNKKGYSVRVGATRLLSKFIKEYRPTKVISFSDVAHTSGGLYDTLGFKMVGITPPNYKWVKGGQVLERHSTMKHVLVKKYPELKDLSENDIMCKKGWSKVYDSGNLLYWLNIDKKN